MPQVRKMKNVEKYLEITTARWREMHAWCRENRIPVIHRWLEPKMDWWGNHTKDVPCSCGSRSIFNHYPARSGSSPYSDDEVLGVSFFVRERDATVWLLRFS